MIRYNFSAHTNNEIAALTVTAPAVAQSSRISWKRCIGIGVCGALVFNLLMWGVLVGTAYIGVGTDYTENYQRRAAQYGLVVKR